MDHTHNQQEIVNFHQDFIASMHSDFFQEQTNRSLFYLPNHSKETSCQCKKKRKKKMDSPFTIITLNQGILTEVEGSIQLTSLY